MSWLDAYANGGGDYTLDYRLDKRGRLLDVKLLNERGGLYFRPSQMKLIWDERLTSHAYQRSRPIAAMLSLLDALGDIWMPRDAQP